MKKKNKQTNRTGEASGSRLISAIPFPQTFPLARAEKRTCRRANNDRGPARLLEGYNRTSL